jgi:hypothetical protein
MKAEVPQLAVRKGRKKVAFSKTTLFLSMLPLLGIMATLHISLAAPLRVGCLAGKPPYVDVVAGKCVGLLADAFYSIMQSSGLEYTMTFINSTTLATLAQGRPTCKPETVDPPECIISRSDIPSIMFNTNNSEYDIGITFTFANALRLRFVDTSIPLVETDYTVLVDGRYAPDNSGALVDAVMRPIVLYLFAIISLFAFVLTAVYFVSESSLVRNSSELLQIKYRSARLRVSFIAAVESVVTSASPLELRSPLSMFILYVSKYLLIFIMAIFTALITSQLTASQANNPPPGLSALAGARIGIQGVLLKPFVAGPRMNAIPVVYDTLDGAIVGFFADNPDRLDGVATQTDIINYFQAVYGPDSPRQTVQTDPFTAAGSPEPRGYLLSRALDSDVVTRFNSALERLRESGQLAAFIAADVPGPPPDDSNDISLPDTSVRAVFLAAKAAAGAMGGVFLALLLFDAAYGRLLRPKGHRAPKAPVVVPPRGGHDTAGTLSRNGTRRRIRQRNGVLAARRAEAAAASTAVEAGGQGWLGGAGEARPAGGQMQGTGAAGISAEVCFATSAAPASLGPSSPGSDMHAAEEEEEEGVRDSDGLAGADAVSAGGAADRQRVQALARELRAIAAYVRAQVCGHA